MCTQSTDTDLPSNRTFGYFFSALFAAIAFYLFAKNQSVVVYVGLITLTVLLSVAATFKPDLLLPLNRLWIRFGHLLGKIISPIIMGAIYFGLFVPMGLVMRVFGRDELRLRIKPCQTYWRPKEVKGLNDDSFNNQF
ncbi:MAG: SxtJ family membrane protein [Proteobacteria bacterium]|nr:SxtJ family membrane protein [Pseudomonadota bacterium]MDA1331820.1 SxtJ family membrane protein [Pseudomonadota bacterium]